MSSDGIDNALTRRLAAIDIGSNSIRLVVAETRLNGEYRQLDDERESTRLGQSLDSTGQLDNSAMDASLVALRRFRKIAEGFQVDRLQTIATCAVRQAENGLEFCQRARDEAGLDVQVISSQEEAQFAFRSVRQAIDLGGKNVVIADIGGGSTEVVLASGNHIEAIYDTDLGALRLTAMHGSPRRLFEEDYERMMTDISRRLKKQVKKLPFSPHFLVGSGGTFTSLGSMLLAAKGETNQLPWGFQASRAEVRHLLDRLHKLPVKQRKSVPGLNPDRADIIVAGLAVIDRLMWRFEVNNLLIHGGGVRDGLLLSMIDDLYLESQDEQQVDEKREDAVCQFAKSCGVELKHALHVAHLAGKLFDGCAGYFSFPESDRWLLTSAAILQDVGYLVNYDGHHKHSYQLIMNSQLPGFTQRELEITSNLARYHRGARPKKKHVNFQRLSKEDQGKVKQYTAILRLAGGLNRSHSQTVQDLEVNIEDSRIKLEVVANSDPEVDLWAARRRADIFEDVFGKEMVIIPVAGTEANGSSS